MSKDLKDILQKKIVKWKYVQYSVTKEMQFKAQM